MQFVRMGRMIWPQAGGATFDPATLFAGGEEGVWYDPSDLSTMFQDDAETTPVAADGDPVAVIRDKSGNGYHARMTTAASRPVYKTSGGLHWLQFDNTDDFLRIDTLSISPASGTDTWSLNYGLNSNSDTAYVLLGDEVSSASYALVAQDASSDPTVIQSGGTVNSITTDGSDLTLSGLTRDDLHTSFGGQHVVRAEFTVPSTTAWGSPLPYRFQTQGIYNYGGFVYSTIFINRALTAEEKSSVDTHIAGKSGVTL